MPIANRSKEGRRELVPRLNLQLGNQAEGTDTPLVSPQYYEIIEGLVC
jgi:hypothetical protein